MYQYTKRCFDIVFACTALLLLAPLLLATAALVWLKLGSPILFRQQRPGLHGAPFTMFKFRTMNNVCDCAGVLLPDHLRLTRFGRWLRSTSLDELPELINVLRGDMSLVGPRPLLLAYLERYTPEQARRHTVLPGMTGWAQINGRNALSWEQKLNHDLWYVAHRSFVLDLVILWRTVARVLARDGITPTGAATDDFAGEQTLRVQ